MALRWGVCGAGKITHDFVIGVKTCQKSDHEVVAVASRSTESASKFAEMHDIGRIYGSYEDLAKDSEIDVVYVGTIHPTHFPVVQLMLDAGKPVLCEKPLTMNVQDTNTLIKRAKDAELFLMEAMWTRFFPAVVELRKEIKAGNIGDVKLVNASFGFRRNFAAGKSRLDDPKLGGGAVLDVGVYPISFATMIFDEKPESIHASGWLTAAGVDELAVITLKYSRQRIAQLSCSIGVDLVNEASVCGTNGILKLPSPFWCPTKLEKPNGTSEHELPVPLMPVNFLRSEGLGYEIHHVRKCIKAGVLESDIMPLKHTKIVAEIMDYVMKELGVVYYQ